MLPFLPTPCEATMVRILATHVAVTWILIGMIWYVQLVHYPLLAIAGRAGDPAAVRGQARRMRWVMGLPMLVELLAALALVNWPPAPAAQGLALVGLGLLLVIWTSTLALQRPDSARLAQEFDPAIHARLVRSNWLRTVLWSLRGAVALGLAFGPRA
jgi:hypothetical protein